MADKSKDSNELTDAELESVSGGVNLKEEASRLSFDTVGNKLPMKGAPGKMPMKKVGGGKHDPSSGLGTGKEKEKDHKVDGWNKTNNLSGDLGDLS